MDILVIGGTGFVGQHLCRELVNREHDVAALSRHPNDTGLPAAVERVAGNAANYDEIEGAFAGRDAVVFLVALSPLFKPRGGERRHFAVHLAGTENAIRAAEAHDVDRYLQMSALDADPTGPTAYLRAKGQAEDVVRASSLDWTIVRPSVAFGAGGEFVPFTKLLAPWPVAPLPGGGRTPFQPIWIGDFAPMLADMLDEDGHGRETYEIGGPEVLRIVDVARLAHRADGRRVRVVPVPMPLAGLGLSVAGAIPFVPFGRDQYRALTVDNTVSDNDVTVFGSDPADLRTLATYLDVEPLD